MNKKEFDVKIRKAGTVHEFEVNNSYGIRDYYRYYKKLYKTDVSEQMYSGIIKELIYEMIEELKKDAYVIFPLNFGYLSTRYIKPYAEIINDKLKMHGYVDWYKTTDLWFSDEEARERKQLVFKENAIYKFIKYSKSGGLFKNKTYLRLSIKRTVNKLLTDDYKNKTSIKPLIYG